LQRVFSFYYFIYFFAGAVTQPFLSLYLNSKGMDGTKIGLLLAAGSGAGMIAQPMLGFLNDRARDARRLLTLSAIISPIVFAGYLLSRQFWVLLVVSIAFAISQATAPIMDAMAVQEGSRSNFEYGQVRLWGALSYALGTMVAGYVYNRTGIQLSFLVYGFFAIAIIMTIRHLPKSSDLSIPRENIWRGIWNVARDARLICFIGISFILSTSISINSTYLPLYYRDLHYPMSSVGLNFTVAALVEVPLFYLSGKLMIRFGYLPVIAVGSLMYTLKYAIMALAPGVVVVIAIQVLDGIAYALYWSAGVQLVSDLAPARRVATAQTLYGAIASSFSNIVGTSVGGVLLDSIGPRSLYACNTGIGALSLLGFLVFAYIIRRKGNPEPTIEQTV
jgi:MFS transporter, PPP family, 3-phenylpropionic acid transporter